MTATESEAVAVNKIDNIIADCEAWAETATAIARTHFRSNGDIDFKSDESPVTFADRRIEEEIKKEILSKYPKDSFFGEESGVDGNVDGNLWVVDPIDGTRSFITGNPMFGLLLARVENGTPVAGTISMPMFGEVFSGGLNRGATCNGKAIHVSGQRVLDDCSIYINEGQKLIAEHPEKFARLLKVGKTQRFGYDCYPHALLAAGYVDVVVDYDLKPYDFLALSSVVRAAGGIMTDWSGNDLGLSSNGAVVSAATPELHRFMIEILN